MALLKTYRVSCLRSVFGYFVVKATDEGKAYKKAKKRLTKGDSFDIIGAPLNMVGGVTDQERPTKWRTLRML